MQTGYKGIGLTEKAAEKVREMLSRRGTPEAAIRIGVTTAGCSGMSYKLEYADTIVEGDQVFEQHGIRVVVDGKSLPIMDGVEMDFVTEQFKSGFRFANPKEKERCGCGESFKI
ncbi:MAG: iron-sulfur cluster assembly accessory protein [Magnetococcales bacterium]|nr:iron-sulfur cluster assembly accessory protein [Magnetococcales bacterium]MBF0151589.1 iron-sulfur cluster assembly accessory protein [Magnetococcales bacterium]MBF0171804.1 iron-sulfur cluster assembly accessory protein [Magnetococcales bacterium]MBF0348731.1 iron-sulfur cluster assembly accessory protein [Magnetococcales bacterium]